MNIKRVLVITVLAIIVMTGIVFTFFVHPGKVKLSVSTIPPDSSITINEKSGRVGTNYLKPGKYTVTARKEGFEDSTKDIDLTSSQSVSFILTPLSAAAKEWAQKNQSLYQQAELKAGKEQQAEGVSFTEKNPIVKFLPYRSLLYDIEYETTGDNSDEVRLVVIAGNATDRGLAISQIRNWGLDPSDYKYRFVSFENPFTPKQEVD